MTDQPPLPPAIWDTLSPEAQAAVTALVRSFERRVAELQERLNTKAFRQNRLSFLPLGLLRLASCGTSYRRLSERSSLLSNTGWMSGLVASGPLWRPERSGGVASF